MELKPLIAADASLEAHGFRAARSLSDDVPGIAIECHENQIPAFAEATLERLYEHLFSSLTQVRVYGGLTDDVSTYVVRDSGSIVTLLLFRIAGDRVQVLNQGLKIGSADIQRFADYIFSVYPQCKLIDFHAVDIGKTTLTRPWQSFLCSEDIVVTLPATAEEYLASLGRNTRRNIRRYMDRLMRSFPSFRMEFHDGASVDEHAVRRIIEFNRARMAGKNKVSTLDDTEAERILRIVRSCGMVGVATIDGEICAGAIGYRVGGNFFLYVLAHDPKYDGYWIGILSCYLTMCECIARGWKELHFLWGRYEYKFTLGAVRRDLYHLTVYRSRAQQLLHPITALRTAYTGISQHVRSVLLESARQPDTPLSRLAFHAFNRLRMLRRSTAALFSSSRQRSTD